MNQVEHLVREAGMEPNSATERLNAFQLITPDMGVYITIEVAAMLSSYSADEERGEETDFHRAAMLNPEPSPAVKARLAELRSAAQDVEQQGDDGEDDQDGGQHG